MRFKQFLESQEKVPSREDAVALLDDLLTFLPPGRATMHMSIIIYTATEPLDEPELVRQVFELKLGKLIEKHMPYLQLLNTRTYHNDMIGAYIMRAEGARAKYDDELKFMNTEIKRFSKELEGT